MPGYTGPVCVGTIVEAIAEIALNVAVWRYRQMDPAPGAAGFLVKTGMGVKTLFNSSFSHGAAASRNEWLFAGIRTGRPRNLCSWLRQAGCSFHIFSGRHHNRYSF